MSPLKRALGALSLAFAVTASAGLIGSPANASTTATWYWVGTYPGTSAGLYRCHADGKQYDVPHQCFYIGEGGLNEYHLWVKY
ncbi:hypothetical protein AB0395_03320 [Streptosporangium sp. NPDC051023]|uniref:hypothetical protein n=1 Tax=Streptosporangium sp. NPDC051023 TaxID=3155410 RepID=UPI00344C74A5